MTLRYIRVEPVSIYLSLVRSEFESGLFTMAMGVARGESSMGMGMGTAPGTGMGHFAASNSYAEDLQKLKDFMENYDDPSDKSGLGRFKYKAMLQEVADRQRKESKSAFHASFSP